MEKYLIKLAKENDSVGIEFCTKNGIDYSKWVYVYRKIDPIYITIIFCQNNFFNLKYLRGFAPHPSSFIGIKEPKELHF